MVEKLVQNCPKLCNANDNHGRNGFLLATWFGKHEVMSFLLKCQMPEVQESLKAKDNDGNNAFHLVCSEGHNEATRVLLTEGRDKIDFFALNNKKENGYIVSIPREICGTAFFSGVVRELDPRLDYKRLCHATGWEKSATGVWQRRENGEEP